LNLRFKFLGKFNL